MSAALHAIFILIYIQRCNSQTNLLYKQKDFTHKPHVSTKPLVLSVTDMPLPGMDSQNQSVVDIPFPGIDPQNLSVTDMPLPGMDSQNQSVVDIPFPGIDPQNLSVTDMPLPGMDSQNQSVVDIPFPGIDPQNLSVTDMPLPGMDPQNQSVVDIPFPGIDPQDLSVTDMPLPGMDPQNQSVVDIPFPGIDPQNLSVTDMPLPGMDSPNQSVVDIPFPGIDHQNPSVADIPLPGRDSPKQTGIDISFPGRDSPKQTGIDISFPGRDSPKQTGIDISFPGRDSPKQTGIDISFPSEYPNMPPGYGCIDFKHWAMDLSRKTNTSTKSHFPRISPKKLENKIFKEFLTKYQKSETSGNKQCYNDTKCVYFGDCCPDKDRYSMDKTYDFYECFTINDTFDSTVDYLLVSKCYPFINNDTGTKEKCERGSNPEHPPVTSNDVGRSYRNEFCAKCNGDWSFTKWDVEIAFKDLDWFHQITRIRNLSDVANFVKLSIRNSMNIFKIPAGLSEPWICNKKYDYIDECNSTGLVLSFEPWEQVGCHSYTNPVRYYRNVYCKRCNWDLFCDLTLGGVYKPVSFAALMDLTALQKYEDHLKAKEKKNICQADEFYDYLYGHCCHLYCSPGLFLTPNSSCSYIMTSAVGMIYKIHFSLIPQNGSITEAEDLHVRNKVLKTIHRNYPPTLFSLVTSRYQLNNQTNQKSAPRVVDKILFYIHFEEALAKFVGMEEDIGTLFSKIRLMGFLRSFRIVKDLESLQFSEDYISTHLCNGSLYKPRLSRNVSSSSPQIALLHSDIRSCPKVRLSSDEFTLKEYYLVISIHASQVNLTMERVEFNSNGTAMICLSDYPGTSPKRELESPTPDFVEIVLSGVFLGLSLLCLTITLTTYALFSELRTLPGKCNIFLCCTLLTAQALMLFGAYDNGISCAVIGSIRHFAWLSTFGWLSVCSFHMYRVFTSLYIWNDLDSNKIIAKYALTAYGLPSIVVAGTVIANMALYGVRVTGYGLPNCFLDQELQLILTFAFPLSLMIIFNTIFLSNTIYSLINTAKQCNIANQDKRRAIVYLKLSSLTGITWFLGFFSMFFPHSWLKYIFIVTNASQGIYVFLSYTFNAKVLKLYTLKFPCLHIPIEHQSNTSVPKTKTTTTTTTTLTLR